MYFPVFYLLTVHPQELSIRPDLVSQIIPPHAEKEIDETTGIDLQRGFEPVDLDQFKVDMD